MADLIFRKEVVSQSNGIAFTKTSEGLLTLTSGTVSILPRDVVRIVYTDTYEKGVYAVALTSTTFSYDPNIYNITLSTIPSSSVFKYNSVEIYDVDTYRIGIEVENGLYSTAYIKYAANISYSLTIPSERGNYFGSVSTLVNSTELVFVDLCKDVAYGVGFSDGGFDTLNNTFKSSLEFNIATR